MRKMTTTTWTTWTLSPKNRENPTVITIIIFRISYYFYMNTEKQPDPDTSSFYETNAIKITCLSRV